VSEKKETVCVRKLRKERKCKGVNERDGKEMFVLVTERKRERESEKLFHKYPKAFF